MKVQKNMEIETIHENKKVSGILVEMNVSTFWK